MRALRRFVALLLLGGSAMVPSLAQAASAQPAAVMAPASSGVVNLNEASPVELERLPGVGPTRAQQIVEHRRTHPFHKIDELTKVKGFGRKTFGRLRPYLAISGATTLHARPGKMKSK